MVESDRIVVVDKNGSRGVVVGRLDTREGAPKDVVVLLDNGEEVIVPWDMVDRRDNGYYLPDRFAKMERHTAKEGTEHAVFPIVAEELTVGKRARETGRVRVTKTVHEREETVDEPILREEVQIERVAINRPVEGPVENRYEGDTLIIPVVVEEPVIQKRLILKEELRITKRRVEERHAQQVTLRREDVDVERIPADERDKEAMRES